MQNILAIFVGILIFFGTLVWKRMGLEKKQIFLAKTDCSIQGKYKKNRFRIIGGMIVSFTISVFMYDVMCRMVGIHFKLCCAYKAWAIALVIYAIYKQFFLNESYLNRE